MFFRQSLNAISKASCIVPIGSDAIGDYLLYNQGTQIYLDAGANRASIFSSLDAPDSAPTVPITVKFDWARVVDDGAVARVDVATPDRTTTSSRTRHSLAIP